MARAGAVQSNKFDKCYEERKLLVWHGQCKEVLNILFGHFFKEVAILNKVWKLISKCFSMTQYSCLKCKIPICNKCSIFQENKDYHACKSVTFLCAIQKRGGKQDIADAEDNYIMPKEPTEL